MIYYHEEALADLLAEEAEDEDKALSGLITEEE